MLGDAGARPIRRMSDVEVDARRSQSMKLKKRESGSEDLSSRYKRKLVVGVKSAGELIKPGPSASVPSSPVSPTVKSASFPVPAFAQARRLTGPSCADTDAGAQGGAGTQEGDGAGGRQTERVREEGSGGRAGFSMRSVPGTGPAVAWRGAPIRAHQPMGAASPRARSSHGRQISDLSLSRPRAGSATFSPSSSLSSASVSASDTSHEPPSPATEPRISISSTIYPSSSNRHSFDIPAYSPSALQHQHQPQSQPRSPGRSSMNPDRESFIDLASPTFPPRSAEYQHIYMPSKQQPILPQSRRSNDSGRGGKSSSSSSASSPHSGSSSSKGRGGLVSSNSGPGSGSGAEKPPIPTAPKPDFSYRSQATNRSSTSTSPAQGKKPGGLSSLTSDLDPGLPTFSAANALSAKERAGRIRTTRKLAQVFGQPPGVPVSPISPAPTGHDVGCMPVPGPLTLNLSAKRKHHQPMASAPDDLADRTPVQVHRPSGDAVWPPPEGTRYVSLAARRHSAPLSPDAFSLADTRAGSLDSSAIIHIGSAEGGDDDNADAMSSATARSRRTRSIAVPESPTSFIDLSDEEGADSVLETPRGARGRRRPFSPSTASLAETVSSDVLAEDERRRKREKLAKLHRFLGSRVPPHLVLGPLDEGAPLPPPASSPHSTLDDGEARKVRMLRRRSSSSAEFSRTWSDGIDRLKEELNEREKAINVRRAVKMEKVSACVSVLASHEAQHIFRST